MKNPRFLPALLLLAVAVRGWTFISMDRILPLDRLYVDEVTYSSFSEMLNNRDLTRPPGMFVMGLITGMDRNVIPSRILISLLSLVPAAAVYVTFRRRRGAFLFAAGAAMSPCLIIYGTQLMPAVPAAALLSLSMASAWRGRIPLAGFLAGTAALFRAELILLPFVLIILSLGSKKIREAWGFAMFSLIPLLPLACANIISGSSAPISANGAENLWLGTDWELLTTPPGTEFEELVSIDIERGPDREFMSRALTTIGSDPGGWAGVVINKGLAFFRVPGPGRNFEIGWIMGRTLLVLLLPLSLFSLSTGTAALFRTHSGLGERVAAAAVITGFITALFFFPSARSRTAVIPAFWFLAAAQFPLRGIRLAVSGALFALFLGMSLLLPYPGNVRPGLTSLLAAQRQLEAGNLRESAEFLNDAESRGYLGADLHNIRGALLATSGNTRAGMLEFRLALEMAPDSPTLWKNYAVSLWNLGLYGESRRAAEHAVLLQPLLREQLSPILEHDTSRE